MISKKYLVFGNLPWDIEGFKEAINSDELYVPHHRLEKDYTMKELKEMDRYDIVPPEELIWLPQRIHLNNTELHKGCNNHQKTEDELFYKKYEKLIEDLNNKRKKNASKKKREFDRLLEKQKRLYIKGGFRWLEYEEQLQRLILEM